MSDHDSDRVIIQMGEILTGVVNACRGEPPDDCSWSTHDAAELASKAASLANAALAIYAPDSGDAEQDALVQALFDWRLVVEDTIRQRAELDALRENQGRIEA